MLLSLLDGVSGFVYLHAEKGAVADTACPSVKVIVQLLVGLSLKSPERLPKLGAYSRPALKPGTCTRYQSLQQMHSPSHWLKLLPSIATAFRLQGCSRALSLKHHPSVDSGS
jgi:hypothetical protein